MLELLLPLLLLEQPLLQLLPHLLKTLMLDAQPTHQIKTAPNVKQIPQLQDALPQHQQEPQTMHQYHLTSSPKPHMPSSFEINKAIEYQEIAFQKSSATKLSNLN